MSLYDAYCDGAPDTKMTATDGNGGAAAAATAAGTSPTTVYYTRAVVVVSTKTPNTIAHLSPETNLRDC
jgi:hypothetical protein